MSSTIERLGSGTARTRRDVGHAATTSLPRPWITRAGVLVTSLSVASTLAGVAVFFASLNRTRPDETIAGLAIVTVGVVLGVRAFSSRPSERALPSIAVVGWSAQLAAVLVYYYSGTALDASRYHQVAALYASGEQRFVLPESNWGVEGIAGALSLIYRVTGPSMLLGFTVFAVIGFLGKMLAVRALLDSRDVLGPGGEFGALFLVLLPSLNVWLGAITKESLTVLGIGLTIRGLVRPNRAPNVLLIAFGLFVIMVVRAHVALLLAAAVVMHITLATALPRQHGGRKALPLIGGAALLALALIVASAYLGTSATVDDFEAKRIELASATDPGGSNIAPTPITGIATLPAGFANVVLRPYPWEVGNLSMGLQAVENLVIAVLALWLITQRRRRRREARFGPEALRIWAMRAFGTIYASGFIFAFSITYNLGLISRQRAQLWLPLTFLLATGFVRAARGSNRRSGDETAALRRGR